MRATVLLCSLALAIGHCAVPGQSGSTEQEPRYDTATVIDVLVTVAEIREAPQKPMAGLHLVVRTGSETLDCYLGPADFLKDFEISFGKGDRVQITGSKVKYKDGQIVLTREVRKNETTVYLRDRAGTPYWSTPDKKS